MVKLDSIWVKRKEQAKKRLDICVTCDKYESNTTRCQECGCFMIAKTLIPFSECPLNKWGHIIEEDEDQGEK